MVALTDGRLGGIHTDLRTILSAASAVFASPGQLASDPDDLAQNLQHQEPTAVAQLVARLFQDLALNPSLLSSLGTFSIASGPMRWMTGWKRCGRSL